jgi:hypothetical protein
MVGDKLFTHNALRCPVHNVLYDGVVVLVSETWLLSHPEYDTKRLIFECPVCVGDDKD